MINQLFRMETIVKNKLMHKSLMAFFVGLLCTVSVSQAAVITLRSGNGVAPGTPAAPVLDPSVKVLQGAAVGDFAALTPANFSAAQAGPAAYVVTGHAAWITPAASVDPLAQWVSVTANGSQNATANPAGSFSGLYAISFNLTGPALASAVLNLTAYADNVLGSATNAGIYLNGVALLPYGGGTNNFTAATARTLTNVNILPFLVAGVNTLYFDVVNTATGPSGLMFSATIATTQLAPVSSVLSLLALGLLMLVVMRNRQFVKF